MSNKIIMGLVLVVVLAGGVFLLNKKDYMPTKSAVPSPDATVNTQDISILTTNGFSPSTLTIKAGTAVTWVNRSGADATINSNPHPVHTDYQPLNLDTFPDGESLSLIFDQPGTYGYHNHLDPSQTGIIIVE